MMPSIGMVSFYALFVYQYLTLNYLTEKTIVIILSISLICFLKTSVGHTDTTVGAVVV